MRQSKVNGMDIAVGAPLMSSDADIDAVIDIVAAEFQPDRPNCLSWQCQIRAFNQ
jgi:hypothetical protein